jgi:hypothetical protein
MTLKNLRWFSAVPVPISLVLVFLFSAGISPVFAQPIIIGHNQSHLEDLKSIPLQWIDSAKANIRLAYFHTSHGSQINTGLTPLDAFMGGNGIYLRSEEGGPGVLFFDDNYGPDLSNHEGTFDDYTRDYLNDPAHLDINLIMWSWCQILGHDGDENPGYCSNMDSLIAEYGPDGSRIKSGERTVPVRFVYMTGHLNGQGEGGRTHEINNYIREHCIAKDRILYDFADIESYDPDDNYFLDDSTNDECFYMVNGQRTGNWAVEWAEGKVMMDGEGDTDRNEPNGGQWYNCSPAHTHAVNGNMKAYAFWYMMARLAGWEGTDTTAVTAVPSFQSPDDPDRLSVFPNPSAETIRVRGDLQFPVVLGIYNMTGRLVREERITTADHPIDVSGLQEGLYILRINGKSRARAASFMKQ